MAKVTAKLQVTVPKALAERYGIAPGDEIDWEAAGDVIRVVPPGKRIGRDPRQRVRLFDQATARQRAREKRHRRSPETTRGWTRDDLYDRGRSR